MKVVMIRGEPHYGMADAIRLVFKAAGLDSDALRRDLAEAAGIGARFCWEDENSRVFGLFCTIAQAGRNLLMPKRGTAGGHCRMDVHDASMPLPRRSEPTEWGRYVTVGDPPHMGELGDPKNSFGGGLYQRWAAGDEHLGDVYVLKMGVEALVERESVPIAKKRAKRRGWGRKCEEYLRAKNADPALCARDAWDLLPSASRHFEPPPEGESPKVWPQKTTNIHVFGHDTTWQKWEDFWSEFRRELLAESLGGTSQAQTRTPA